MRAFPPRLIVVAVTILLALLAGCGRDVDRETMERFAEAQRVIESARSHDDFLIAAGIYQGILDRGIASGAVLYNQGNAFLHAGKRGRAIAAYRSAQHYWPRNPYLEANLTSALGPEPHAGRRRPLVETILFWLGSLNDLELYRAAGVAAAAALAFGAARLWLRRRILGWLAAASLIAVCLCALSAGYRWYRHEHASRGVVVNPETVVHQGPARSYAPVVAEPLRDGAEFRILELRDAWLQIRLSGGQEGWVERNHAMLY